MPMVKVFKSGTNVRRGGSTQGQPDNIIGAIGIGEYNAITQAAGQEVVEGANRNFWWVKLATPVGEGWVSAVRISTGGNDAPIPGVPTEATVFA
jgi:hypothetical protein